ncbi:carbamoyl-phosphate synthase (glutamine-hydrolyzing) large subunit, partial [Candidatus Gottesmanbacteria bacterium]|nr:carbamoyl-phosphate synthase (glutamine-hydrolyzing) large subunit [Candidatus Gottesmanbacteria bacterium]
KEFELELLKDSKGNTIVICCIENFDPMGIHTGESIVVAPSQTLNNHEYHLLREIAIKVIKSLPIVGECNIQYALNPKNGDYRIIEVNARLSRSSALASKATGYPLAYVAAKLALGLSLSEIKNKVTQATSAFFEPSLDYVVVKIPRWDFFKFKNMDEDLGSEMQSVGEVMAIGRTFEEAFQKAIRSLDIDYEGIIGDSISPENIKKTVNKKNSFQNLLPTPDRPYRIAHNIFYGQSLIDIYKKTGIDLWFLERIKNIVSHYKKLLEESVKTDLKKVSLSSAKLLGFSDQQIGEIYNLNQDKVRSLRKNWKILPKICQIDTLGGEFPAKTNYLYLSYHRTEHDISKPSAKQVAVLGGGPYQIGSSVEFDWCAVNSVLTAKSLGFSPIMINNNPETVSTDYDISDKLYFEELTLERIMDIIDFENCPLIVSVGGQIPNTLVPKLTKYKVKLLGTSPRHIEQAEDRNKFSRLLDKLKIKQPIWQKLTTIKDTLMFANKIKYPVLLRPSFVLSGKAMFEAYSKKDLVSYFKKYNVINNVYPLVISKFIRGAREVDFDAVAAYGNILTFAISEHVEHSGVHSGDATLVLPTFSLSKAAEDKIAVTAAKIAMALKIHGPFNIQFLVNNYSTDNPDILVIEANLRASRSFPFVSKTYGINFITLATKVMLGNYTKVNPHKKLDFYCVKVPRFSFTRLRKVDPILRVEMASTGEVASFGDTFQEAYLKAVLSTGTKYPSRSVLLSLGGEAIKNRFLPAAKILQSMGFKIYATENTERYLKTNGIKANFVYKFHEKKHPCVLDLIQSKKVSLVINISERSDLSQSTFDLAISDGYLIR